MKTEIVLGQPSWRLRSNRVRLAITRLGGFLGPVHFQLGRQTISPYAVPPWAGRKDAPRGAIGALRGDVFCLPFGGNHRSYRGETHPPHGDPFHGRWKPAGLRREGRAQTLALTFALKTRAGAIRKEVTLRDDETVIYQRHVIAGLSGRMSYGYHATLDFSGRGEGRISTSRVLFGRTHTADFESAAGGGYCSLRPDAIFRRLDRVPCADGSSADLTRYPAEEGFENLALLANDPAGTLAWTAVTFPDQGWVWFSLKDPRELSCTLLWLSNGGRHYPPWNGRHRARLGLEEVTALPEGLAEAAADRDFPRRGVAVCRTFDCRVPQAVRSATGICAVPRGFDRVQSIRLAGDAIELRAHSGKRAATAFDGAFFTGTSNGARAK
jgi:hypothetical protein